MKKFILGLIVLILFTSFLHTGGISKIINIPSHSKILSLTFRYLDTSGNMQVEKNQVNTLISENGILFSQTKINKSNYFMKISTKDISRITSLIVEYQDRKGNKFFKPVYYYKAILKTNAPLYAYHNNSNNYKDMLEKSSNSIDMPIMNNMQDDKIIDGFMLRSDGFNIHNTKNQKSELKITKAINMHKYDFKYINKIIQDIYVDGVNVATHEKQFCIIPIRDTISYILSPNKKNLFLIFKDFELSSDVIISNNKAIIKFPSENKFKTCRRNNISKYITKLEAFHKDDDGGEANVVLHTSKSIKSASVVYPANKKSISSFDKELKDVLIYKIEIN